MEPLASEMIKQIAKKLSADSERMYRCIGIKKSENPWGWFTKRFVYIRSKEVRELFPNIEPYLFRKALAQMELAGFLKKIDGSGRVSDSVRNPYTKKKERVLILPRAMWDERISFWSSRAASDILYRAFFEKKEEGK